MRRLEDNGGIPGPAKEEPVGKNATEGLKNGKKIPRVSRGKLSSRLITLAVTGCMLFIGLGSVNCATEEPSVGALTSEEVKQLKNFIATHNVNYTSFTYDQLNQWFENQIPEYLKFEEFPRLYPFCVTAAQINDSRRTATTDNIYKFLKIFESMEKVRERFYNFDKMKHSVVHDKNWIAEINLTRINTPEMDMVNLRQWLHIRVKTKDPVKGLYMQSIVGPMGLPFGEFNLDFPCKDDPGSQDLDEIGQLTHCSYRPRTTIQHPSVYVGLAKNNGVRNEFHMNFFWTDITCMETPYLQFLMLVVKDFDYNATTKGKAKLDLNYKPLFSPVYLNTDFDSKSGAPFPYYPEWKDKMYCYLNNVTFPEVYAGTYNKTLPSAPGTSDSLNPKRGQWPSPKAGADTQYAPLNWIEDLDTFRVQPNEAYDACITDRMKDPSLRDPVRLECPPGPFRCDTSYGTEKDRTVITAQRKNLTVQENILNKCNPCGAPPCLELGFPEYKCDNLPDELVVDINESNELNTVESIIRGKTHGLQAMFAFLVLVPISNFLARFYKEVCGHCLCDNGPWIFVHIGTHIVSVVFMWLSIGPVMPRLSEIKSAVKECKAKYFSDKDRYSTCLVENSASNPHVPLALVAFMLQHFLIAFGFWRVSNVKLRMIQVALHSHIGYFCWIVGAISSIVAGATKLRYNPNCFDVVVLSCLFFVTPLIFSAVGVALDCLTDRRVGIIPPRRQWPVLEAVKLEGRGPFTMPKWIVFGVYCGIMILFWLLALGSGFTIIGSADRLFNDKQGRIQSLFGKGCGGKKDWDAARARATLPGKKEREQMESMQSSMN